VSLGEECDLIVGTVVRGDGRGRMLGFPTANLQCDGDLDVADGIYAAWTTVAGADRIASTVSIGSNPTFPGERSRRLEVHLHDVYRDLYGRRLGVELVAFLRPTLRFADVAALVAQSEEDVRRSRAALAPE